ncbi:hypothetical protein [Mycolicibacterium diernhoferi]|uniref:hypothetical protein n=1 Tax=Mycolicibacterium diernhoferi TaxID=1801 RepID=UPI0013F634E3|nr:hypothetical protein [Mycolicibacterium diernhoferi]QYL21039.1 hypothetical protein K0O62_18550 [Mycolicibacterium diernhoferi]
MATTSAFAVPMDADTSGTGSEATRSVDTVLTGVATLNVTLLVDSLESATSFAVPASSIFNSVGARDDSIACAVAGVTALRSGLRLGGRTDLIECEPVVFDVDSSGSGGVNGSDVVVVPELGSLTAAPGVELLSELLADPAAEPDGEADDDEASVSPVSAHAGTETTADPIPNATANAPTRPMYLADPTAAPSVRPVPTPLERCGIAVRVIANN